MNWKNEWDKNWEVLEFLRKSNEEHSLGHRVEETEGEKTECK
jgi:hypothetical protein